MILEEKSQELKRRRWLEERDDEYENQRDNENAKKVKIEKLMEIKVINRICAVTLDCEVNMN